MIVRLILTINLLASLAACSPGFETIRIVNEVGAPVQGATVFSRNARESMLSLTKNLDAVSVSSTMGKVQVVKNSVPSIIKNGYYPVLQGAFYAFGASNVFGVKHNTMVRTETPVENTERNGDTYVLRRVIKPSITAQTHELMFISSATPIEFSICGDVLIVTDPSDHTGRIQVLSHGSPLYASSSFFFSIADVHVETRELRDFNRPFYCISKSKQIFKVGLTASASVSVLVGNRQEPARRIQLVSIPVVSLYTPPEPQLLPNERSGLPVPSLENEFRTNISRQDLITSIEENFTASADKQRLLQSIKKSSIVSF